MANRYDNNTSWSPFPAPATSLIWPHPHAASCRFSSSPAAAAFENNALASALLQASMMPPPPSSPTPSSSTTTTTTSSASELSSVHHHDAPAPAPAPHGVSRGHGSAASKVQARRCKGSGVSKRKPNPRASRRPPTTYISAGPADFRRMVQEITGLAVPASGADAACPVASASWPQDQLAFVLPTLDTSASFMLDCAPPSPLQRWEDKPSLDGAATAMAAAAEDVTAVAGDYPSLLLMRELEAMVSAPAAASSSSFPTLESWGMI